MNLDQCQVCKLILSLLRMATLYFSGLFNYERDYDLAIVPAKFRVLSESQILPPSAIGAAYLDCLGTTLPATCRTCTTVDPRHYVWVGLATADDTEVQTHKVPVGLLTNLAACLTALEAAGSNPCIYYKGEDFRNIHRLFA